MKLLHQATQITFQSKTKEAKLFMSVIIQALDDAEYKGLDKKYLQYKYDALTWLTSFTDDFCLICNLAEFEPEYIRSSVVKLIKQDKLKFTQAQYDVLFNSNKQDKIIINLFND